MQIFRYAEQGSIGLLWISATNPAVSMPESARIRRILGGDQCFVVVQDLFLTETAELADVVLPAAGWGEKTGSFTNVNRTVHLSEQAVDPPGEARSDLDIFLTTPTRWASRDRGRRAADRRGGRPRRRSTPGGECTAGRPVRLHRPRPTTSCAARSGIPWPVQRRAPRRHRPALRRRRLPHRHRLLRDLRPRPADRRQRHRAASTGRMAPAGRAFLKGGAVHAAARGADDGLPAAVHHRAHRLPVPHPHQDRPVAVARTRPRPDAVGRAVAGRRRRGSASRRATRRVESPRGAIEVPRPGRRVHATARCSRRSTTALGPRRRSTPRRRHRQANELTMTVWDPVSKQPLLQDRRLPGRPGRAPATGPAPAPTTTASAPAAPPPTDRAVATGGGADDRPADRAPRYALDPPGGRDAAPRDLRRPRRTTASRRWPTRSGTVGRRARRRGRRLPHLPDAGRLSDDHRRRARPGRRALRRGSDDVDEPERLHADGLAEARDGRGRAAARPAGPARARHPRADHLDRDRPGRAGAARPRAARGRHAGQRRDLAGS